ncbi:MAG TPA: hypothetical protein VFY64_06620 [Nitrososphaeraceae archaeon]|nr:hypothetical protein [Nitrososphaeraceae archaeon]
MVSKIKSKKRKNGKQTKATKKSKANLKKKRNIKKTSPTTARQKKVSRGTKTRTRTRPTTTTTTTTAAITNPNTEENDLLAIQNNSSLVDDTAKTHEAQEEL